MRFKPENFISPQERFLRMQEQREKLRQIQEWQRELSHSEQDQLRHLGKGGNILKDRWRAEANAYLHELVNADPKDGARIAVLQDRILTRERWIRVLQGKPALEEDLSDAGTG